MNSWNKCEMDPKPVEKATFQHSQYDTFIYIKTNRNWNEIIAIVK